ncbi:MAG: methyltransferase type 11 [uncultured bacterium]|nr:MAG: methyltransferase type 11 [uncultured bacterium]
MSFPNEQFLNILACPCCGDSLKSAKSGLICNGCQEKFRVCRGIPVLLSKVSDAASAIDEVSERIWKKLYEDKKDMYDPKAPPKEIAATAKSVRQILRLQDKSRGIFMEAGCGTGRTALEIACHSQLTIICLDRSLQALLKAQQLFAQTNQPAHFVCGDLRNLPFKSNSLNYVFSDGTIEHFKETQTAVDEFRRVLKNKGQVLATVPHLALGMLTYGQLQGNIPNVFPLRNLLEFFHIKLMKGKFLINGFELSFTRRQLARIFKNFYKKNTGYFKSYNEISFIKNQRLKKILRKMSDNKFFCPVIYAHGIKDLRRR